ncbi:phosphoprotein [Vaprio virus]|uniref:Phosphoprotein n=1 Tax=Vaprio virus TaxID=2100727 RepID=A0A2P1BSX4_9RHAB|nr:phosphoprotein [Vaprio virus]AVI57364.1 phosphoprotein [Vaprio virus]
MNRSRVKELANRQFFKDIEGKQFDEDEDELTYQDVKPTGSNLFERKEDELEIRPEEEEFDEEESEEEGEGIEEDLDQDQDVEFHDPPEQVDSENDGMVSAVENLDEESREESYIESELNHLALSDHLESKMSASEKAASSEDESEPDEVKIEFDKIQLPAVRSQEELDDICFGMFHALVSKIGWSLIPLHCKAGPKTLTVSMAPVGKPKRRRNSSYNEEPPILENLKEVNKGKSSETIEENKDGRFKDMVSKIRAGQIRFMKKKNNGYMVLGMDTPGMSEDLIERCLNNSANEGEAVEKMLEETGMLPLVQALCKYP